jgi:hypothetical protein
MPTMMLKQIRMHDLRGLVQELGTLARCVFSN